ncbi:MAG: single-stranded-DNA-specific exonuclease RecJ [Christensenellales bacterium]
MIRFKAQNYTEETLAQARALSQALNVSLELAKVLTARGVGTLEKARQYLSPDISQLHDPMALKDMDKAVARIKKALKDKERIVIYGDYDADGVTAVTILMKVLENLGAQVHAYLPERQQEGYGVHAVCIQEIHDEYAPGLIITVDCGITAVEEVREAGSLGIDMIITDHHECPDVLPDAAAVINPKRKDQAYPCDFISGVGTAAKLVQALCGVEALAPHWDVIALGTIADIVPLMDENRVFASYGMEKMRKNPCAGLGVLMDVAARKRDQLSASDVAFFLAPRINASGRMDSANIALSLLLAQDMDEAAALAQTLDELNRLRQSVEREIMQEAVDMVEAPGSGFLQDRILILTQEGWDDGVVGIVASRMAERYSRPVLMLCRRDDGVCRGSGRSISGVDLYRSMRGCEDLFQRFGGHSMAVGVSMAQDKVDELRRRMNEAMDAMDEEIFLPQVSYDSAVELSQLDMNLARELRYMEPVGFGNATPLFYVERAKVERVGTMGAENRHIRMHLSQNGTRVQAVAFGWGDREHELNAAEHLDFVCRVNINVYRGEEMLQLQMRAATATPDARMWLSRVRYDAPDFFRAFFAGIYYNKPNPFFAESGGLDWDDLKARIASSRLGTLILATSEVMAQELLRAFEDEIARRRLDVTIGKTPRGPHLFNTLVMAPDERMIAEAARWTAVYVCGVPVALERADGFVPDKSAVKKVHELLDKYLPDRKMMSVAYRRLLRSGGRIDSINWRLAFARDVFMQLGLIQKTGDDKYLFTAGGGKKQLSQSELYRLGIQCTTQWKQLMGQLMEKE